jgi:hypothetical protein
MIPLPKIIFFIKSSAPTDEEYLASLEYGPTVAFRRADYAGEERPELADAVTALDPDTIPHNYRRYPSPDDAMNHYRDQIAALRDRVLAKRASAGGVADEPTAGVAADGGVQQNVSPGAPGAPGHSWNRPGAASLAPLNEQRLMPEAPPPAEDDGEGGPGGVAPPIPPAPPSKGKTKPAE